MVLLLRSCSSCSPDTDRLFVLIDRYKCKITGDRLLPLVGIHLLNKYIYSHFEAGITQVSDFSNKLNNRSCRYRVLEIDTVAANGNYLLPAKTGGSNKGYLIHQLHSGTTKKGIVMISITGKYSFENMRFCCFYLFLYGHDYLYNR